MPTSQMLINYVPGEECRIAIVEDGQLEEFYQERASAESHVGNIYKGRVVNVEPSIQAAFVDFGLERNGFLHISDLHPKYFPGKDREEFEKVGSKTPRRDRPPIQRCLRRGQEVLVQVLKEGISTKGPTLTSYLSIPGRYLVMMPSMERLGVSRKVDDDEARREMRKILADLNPPEGFGFIVRTAGLGQTKTDLKRDLAYLHRLYKSIDRRQKQIGRVGELYAESDLVIRTIRDVFTNDIDRIVVDDITAARRAHDFLAIANPRARSKVVYYNDPVPLFDRFRIEPQIDIISAGEVPLPSGGSLVIDQTEALVAIDVNSGKSRDARDAESNAYRTNEEAVDEICRQLRLRDLGGVVVNDLIDMRQSKHRRAIEQRMRKNLKKDRARTRIGPISSFGILEMTRQRMRPSLRRSLFMECTQCHGMGHVKNPESVVLSVMRKLALVMHRDRVARLEITISPDVAFQLLNRKRRELTELETRHNKPVLVRVGGSTIDFVEITAFDDRGGAIDAASLLEAHGVAPQTETSFVELEPANEDLLDQLEEEAAELAEAPAVETPDQANDSAAEQDDADEGDQPGGKKKRRRRRGGRRRKQRTDEQRDGPSDAPDAEGSTDYEDEDRPVRRGDEPVGREAPQGEAEPEAAPGPAQRGDAGEDDADEKTGRKRRRRRRGGRGRRKRTDDAEQSGPGAPAGEQDADRHQPADTERHSADASAEPEAPHADRAEAPADAEPAPDDAPPKKKKTRRRSRSRKKLADADTDDDAAKAQGPGESPEAGADEAQDSAAEPDAAPAKPKRKRAPRKRKTKAQAAGEAKPEGAPGPTESPGPTDPKPNGSAEAPPSPQPAEPTDGGYRNPLIDSQAKDPEPSA